MDSLIGMMNGMVLEDDNRKKCICAIENKDLVLMTNICKDIDTNYCLEENIYPYMVCEEIKKIKGYVESVIKLINIEHNFTQMYHTLLQLYEKMELL